MPGSTKAPSDHFAVRLSFNANSSARGTRRKIPEWLAREQLFLDQARAAVLAILSEGTKNPAKRLVLAKRSINSTASSFMAEHRKAAATKASTITLGLNFLRSARSAPRPSPQRLLDITTACPSLREAASSDLRSSDLSFTSVQDLVKSCFAGNPRTQPLRGKPNFLSTAKKTLPESHRTLSYLQLSDHRIVDDPQAMADQLKSSWGPVWDKPDPPEHVIHEYLRDYQKQIRDIPQPTLETVSQVIAKCRDSATGPDGIPFSIYRNMVDIFAPIFLDLTLHMSGTGRPNSSFNLINLFFFPKGDSNHPSKLRPISVSNSDNRIIANVVRSLISPAIGEILDKSQRGFLARRSIEDNILGVNQAFYSHLESKSDLHVLLHDFEKAYDSASRRFLFAVLKRVGTPDWIVRILELLFTKVSATPILSGPHKTTINMPNGLKQGCPLSPILFNLLLDPLLTKLAQANELTWGYADDLALAVTELRTLGPLLQHIEAFNAASGSSSSPTKTYIVSTRQVSQAEQQRHVPQSWTIQPRDSATYLGILFGRDVTVSDIFTEPLAELRSRVTQYLPSKDMYTLTNRIIVANSFLLPTLSFHQRFFLMPPAALEAARASVREWVSPGKLLGYEHLCRDTASGGMAQPLRDVRALNIASLLSRRDASSALDFFFEILNTLLLKGEVCVPSGGVGGEGDAAWGCKGCV
jgi:hypothetical protein